MNETVTSLRDHAGVSGVEDAERIERYLRDGGRMLDLARKRLIELEVEYTRKRRQVVHRLADEIAKLDSEHESAVRSCNSVIARLEAMREGS